MVHSDDEPAGEETADDSLSPFAKKDRKISPPTIIPWDKERALTFAEKMWSLPVLYDNPDGRFFQKIKIIGRYHGQYGNVSAKQGDWDGWENRRTRVGLVADFMEDFRFRIQLKQGGESGSLESDNVEDAWVSWKPSLFDEFVIQVGQFKPLWSYEWGLSSNTMPVFERNQFVNQFAPDRALGAMIGLRHREWGFAISGFSGDIDDESGTRVAEGSMGVLNFGYDFTERVSGWDSLNWRLDYIYNDGAGLGQHGQPYRQGVSTNFSGQKGRWSGAIDFNYVDDVLGQGDAFGLTVLPTYDVIPGRVQLAMRYHYSTSDDQLLVLQNRYEQKVSGIDNATGDNYHSFYAGLNWFIYGEKLKLMTGLEYSTMDSDTGGDFDGWTFFSGVRLWF